MKNIQKNRIRLGIHMFVAIIIGLALFSFYPNRFEKKVVRHLKKVYNVDEYSIENIEDINLYLKSNTELFRIEENDLTLGYFAVTLAVGCNEGGCTIESKKNEFEFFYMMTMFDQNAQILKVKILEYDSEYGYEIMAPGWLKQFEKNKNKILEYDKEIDGISGATKSVNSVINEINIISNTVRGLVEIGESAEK